MVSLLGLDSATTNTSAFSHQPHPLWGSSMVSLSSLCVVALCCYYFDHWCYSCPTTKSSPKWSITWPMCKPKWRLAGIWLAHGFMFIYIPYRQVTVPSQPHYKNKLLLKRFLGLLSPWTHWYDHLLSKSANIVKSTYRPFIGLSLSHIMSLLSQL